MHGKGTVAPVVSSEQSALLQMHGRKEQLKNVAKMVFFYRVYRQHNLF